MEKCEHFLDIKNYLIEIDILGVLIGGVLGVVSTLVLEGLLVYVIIVRDKRKLKEK